MRVYPNWHRGLVQAQVRKHQEFDSPYPHHLGLYFNGRKRPLQGRGCAFESHQIHHTKLAQMVESVVQNHEVSGSNPLFGKLQVMLGEAAHSNNLIINPWYNIKLDLNNNITNSQKVILYIYIIPTKRNNKVNQTK